jgi:hypothetical protein
MTDLAAKRLQAAMEALPCARHRSNAPRHRDAYCLDCNALMLAAADAAVAGASSEATLEAAAPLVSLELDDLEFAPDWDAKKTIICNALRAAAPLLLAAERAEIVRLQQLVDQLSDEAVQVPFLRQQLAEAERQRPLIAWLVELPAANDKCQAQYFPITWRLGSWALHANQALRFARREDAESFVRHMRLPGVKAVEHIWLAAAGRTEGTP